MATVATMTCETGTRIRLDDDSTDDDCVDELDDCSVRTKDSRNSSNSNDWKRRRTMPSEPTPADDSDSVRTKNRPTPDCRLMALDAPIVCRQDDAVR
jgi:hypothetical protein